MITSDKNYIFFDFEKNLYMNSIEKVFNQNNLYFDKSLKNLKPNLSINIKEEKLEFISGQIKTTLFLPTDSRVLINEVMNIVNQLHFDYKNFKFYPYLKLIKRDTSSAALSNSHNIILFNLFVFEKSGIDKNHLYSCIWPKDKEIFLNKLDTHLTNLKNYIFNHCGENIDFRTVRGLLKLN